MIAAMKVYNFQSLNQAYEKAKKKGLRFNPSRQTVEYRMKKLDMEEISRLILKAVKKFVVVDSTLIYYGRKKRRWTKLHVFYIAGVGMPVWWKVNNGPDWEVGEEFLKFEPVGIIADHGYWMWDFLYECRRKGISVIVKPRGRKGRAFMEVYGQIYKRRWEIEHFFQRLKGELVLGGVNLKTLRAKVKIRLLGEMINKLCELWRKGEIRALGI